MFPLPLNLTVNLPSAPGAKGSLDQSLGIVQPQELLTSVITNGASPVFLYVNTVSTGVPLIISPKSCSVLSNSITGNFDAASSLTAASATLESSTLLDASS